MEKICLLVFGIATLFFISWTVKYPTVLKESLLWQHRDTALDIFLNVLYWLFFVCTIVFILWVGKLLFKA